MTETTSTEDVRDFGQISRSLAATDQRVEDGIATLRAGGLTVTGYEEALVAAKGARSPIQADLDSGLTRAVCATKADLIQAAFRPVDELILKIKQVAGYLEMIPGIESHLEEAAARTEPVTLVICEDKAQGGPTRMLEGFIAFAANPAEHLEKSRTALADMKQKLDEGDLEAVAKLMPDARFFGNRVGLLASLTGRGVLVEKTED